MNKLCENILNKDAIIRIKNRLDGSKRLLGMIDEFCKCLGKTHDDTELIPSSAKYSKAIGVKLLIYWDLYDLYKLVMPKTEEIVRIVDRLDKKIDLYNSYSKHSFQVPVHPDEHLEELFQLVHENLMENCDDYKFGGLDYFDLKLVLSGEELN